MELSFLRVAVVGGGIGGMAAALALAREGARVVVHERASELGEVGAGLQVSANGQAALRALGLGPRPAGAVISTGTVIRDHARGRRVARVLPPRAGATWYVHRADLLRLLADAARAAGVEVRLGAEGAPGSLGADLIVAADGGRSEFRTALDGADGARFTGQVAWRALVTGARLAPEATLTLGPGAHLVAYPLRDGTLGNLVAVEARRDWTAEGWRQPGDPAEFRRRFARFGGEAGALVAQATRVHLWALHQRPVARRWQDGRVALLGDAAHPTLPFLAQGACLALEDAVVLARALAASGTVAEGLARYEAARRGRAQRVVRIAGGNAWRFHLTKPWAWGAQAVLAAGGRLLARRLEPVYGYDPGAVPV